MKNILITIVSLLFLIGCGDEFNSSPSKEMPKEENVNDMALHGNDFQNNINDKEINVNKRFLTKSKWENSIVKWYYNPNKQKFKNTTEAITIFKSAMKRWSNISGIKFEYQGTTTTTQFNLYDNKVVFGWADPTEVRKHFGGDGSIGAFVWYRSSGNKMLDARLTLNTARFNNWTNPYTKKYVPRVQSWKGLITHELGHVLGIAHSNISQSIMYANPYNGTVYMETLRNDDISAVTELYPKVVSPEVIKGEFDGAMSLVSPNEECWGCNKDEVRMHPHEWTGSTVAVQWLYDKNTCSQIDIYANSEIEVAIKAKPWKEHLTQEAFKVTLGSQPITIKKPNSDSLWTTLAITTVNNNDKDISIKAYCRTSQNTYYKGDRTTIDTDLVDVTYDYFWTGTASLISRAKKINDFGHSRDWAVTFRTKKSLTSFQWDTTNCKKVKITNGTTSNDTKATVDMKSWSESNKEYKNKCTSLPCIIEKNSNNYYILKIKSDAGIVSKGFIQVECIE